MGIGEIGLSVNDGYLNAVYTTSSGRGVVSAMCIDEGLMKRLMSVLGEDGIDLNPAQIEIIKMHVERRSPLKLTYLPALQATA